jgi:hypothetical protein
MSGDTFDEVSAQSIRISLTSVDVQIENGLRAMAEYPETP